MDLPGEGAEDDGEQHQERHEAQNHQGEGVVEHEHSRQYAHHDKGVFHHVYQDVGEHHGDGVGVVGDAGDQLAHGNLIELIVGQPLDVGE